MKKKILFSALVGSILIASAVAIPLTVSNNSFIVETSSSNSNEKLKNFSISPNTQQTGVRAEIGWVELGLNVKNLQEIINDKLINAELILKYKDVIFTGTTSKITSPSHIKEVLTRLGKNNTIDVRIKMAPGTCYNNRGELVMSDQIFDFYLFELKQTISKETVDASALGLGDNVSVDEAIMNINPPFVFKHRNKLLTGKLDQLNNPEQIKNVKVTVVSEISIELSFDLVEGSWYDQYGLGKGSKNFTVTIALNSNAQKPDPLPPQPTYTPTGFKSNITATDLGLNTTTVKDALNQIDTQYIITNKDKFFTGELSAIDNTSDILNLKQIEASSTSIQLTFDLAQGAWYEEHGLGNGNKKCSITIEGFKAPEPLPPPPPSDSTTPSQPEPQPQPEPEQNKKIDDFTFYLLAGIGASILILLIIIIVLAVKIKKVKKAQKTN